MRVVHIIKVIRIAGAEQHLLTLLAGLRQRQIDARLLLLVEPDNDMRDYVDKLEARDIPVQRVVIHHHADIGLLARLRRELRTLQPDIVHTHLIHADLYGILAARRAGVPAVISSRHNDDAFRYQLPVKVVNWMLWRMVSAGIAISDSIARFSIDIEGAPKRIMHRIHYGLDASVKPLDRNAARNTLLQEWALPARAVMIGMVCRLVEQKGVRYGLDAFIQVAPAFPQAHLLIAGEGPLRAELEDRAKQAGLMNRVHFPGWRADVPALLAGLDILLAPSLWEGFGLVMLEAMAQQTAVIASRVSAIPEVVSDGETGLLVAPRDVPALTDALHQLLIDAPLRQHMGLLGRDRMETHFSAGRMVDETVALYHTLLDGL
jgi:glycosyltransferase involved in cell wall biosynthesis